jgi:hypothetical protein
LINWRRGFLRGWLVLTILWIGFFGWNKYDGHFEDWFVAPIVPADDDCSKQLGKWPSGKAMDLDLWFSELPPDAPPDALPLIRREERTVSDPRPDPNGTGLARAFDRDRWRDVIRKKIYDCEAAHEAAEPAFQRFSVRAAKIWADARESLVFVVLPPFALLFLGYVLNWIVSGFRASA